MSSRTEYHALFVEYKGCVGEIITSVRIGPADATDASIIRPQVEVDALWDTGADVTCIKPSLRDKLQLSQPKLTERIVISGVGGDAYADSAPVQIWLDHGLVMKSWPVYIADFPGDAELLIGMDIITMGDFVICNTNGKTSFSFAMPPLPDRINLFDRAAAANR